VIGSNEFLSCHIAFLFEYLDNADLKGKPSREDVDAATSAAPTDESTESESRDQ
jgi:hypothetical protein